MIHLSKEQNKPFTGPLFIVGMPRSGTKLLRDLLNEHPAIGIAYRETEFLPYWAKNWSFFGDLSEYENFKKFYHAIMNFPYFISMREDGRLIQVKTWFDLCKTYTPAGVFEALVRHDAQVKFGTTKVWGDKSPSYIRHLPLLKELFPNSRFIHIIRDVRDYCLSINKTWGKNMIRAAQRWVDDVKKAMSDAKKFSEDYIEVRYEDLIESPEITLREICTFLNVEFDKRMLHLSKPAENLGDTKGKKDIIRDNKEKYLKLMKPSIRKKIEAIAASVLKSCGYAVDYSGEIQRASRRQMLYYQVLDGFSLFKSNMRERGFFTALKFHFKQLITYGNKTR